MHGMILKAIETFVTDRHGIRIWHDIVRDSAIGVDHFDTMRRYDGQLYETLLPVAAKGVQTTPFELLEDIGTWICTHPPLEPVRRLFRFSGETFEDMLYSLEDMHDRARLALPDIMPPVLSLTELGEGQFRVASSWAHPGASGLLLGVLRTLSDDYGTLTFLERLRVVETNGSWFETVSVHLLDSEFSTPRAFDLASNS